MNLASSRSLLPTTISIIGDLHDVARKFLKVFHIARSGARERDVAAIMASIWRKNQWGVEQSANLGGASRSNR